MTSKTTNKFSSEVRARAVRMVLDHEGEHASRWAAVVSIATKIGCTPQTLNEWVKKADVDSGRKPGPARQENGSVSTIWLDMGKATRRKVAINCLIPIRALRFRLNFAACRSASRQAASPACETPGEYGRRPRDARCPAPSARSATRCYQYGEVGKSRLAVTFSGCTRIKMIGGNPR
jgi:transposase-like protein